MIKSDRQSIALKFWNWPQNFRSYLETMYWNRKRFLSKEDLFQMKEFFLVWYLDTCLEVAEALNAFNSNNLNLSTGNKLVFSRAVKSCKGKNSIL